MWDDDATDLLVEAHLQGILPAIFSDKGGDNRLSQSWCGIMGFTTDVLPFVGKLDPWITRRTTRKENEMKDLGVSPSEWIAAGFCGEGMVMAWLSGVAVALMILGLEDEELLESPGGKVTEWLPTAFGPNYSRIKNLNMLDAAGAL